MSQTDNRLHRLVATAARLPQDQPGRIEPVAVAVAVTGSGCWRRLHHCPTPHDYALAGTILPATWWGLGRGWGVRPTRGWGSHWDRCGLTRLPLAQGRTVATGGS